jgi:serine protease
MKIFFKLVSTIVFTSFFSFTALAQENQEQLKKWAYDSIHIPINKNNTFKGKPIIVAVIDDAFNINHKTIKDFIYKNPFEKNNNSIDEDANGYIDDVAGWDISDNDNNVSVAEENKNRHYHGTYIASIIANIVSLHYNETASQRIKIMPIKVLSDHTNSTYLKDGYKGIKYAIDNGADIICLAWCGGNPTPEEIKIIQEAHNKGILIIVSSGNFNEEKVLSPARIPNVFAVAGINKNFEKEPHSNFGIEIAISAPGENVFGAHSEKENAYFFDSGTSPATAIVTGCAAILLSKKHINNIQEVKEAILNSATLFSVEQNKYNGKMGAGIINLEKAIDYSKEKANKDSYFLPKRTRGNIIVNKTNSNKDWNINLEGGFHGIHLKPNLKDIKDQEKHSVDISIKDTLWNTYKLSELPSNLFVPSASIKLSFKNNSFKKKDVLKIEYYGKSIDSTKLYCQDIPSKIHLESGSGFIEDGSNENNYSNNCSCKWIITAPEGKKIKFIFDKMDTESNIDFVYLVNGQTAIPDRIFAKFSGSNIPPVVYSATNEALIWFVTDTKTTENGWSFKYEIVD